MRAFGILALTCLLVALGLTGCSSGASFNRGDCLRGPLGSSQQDLVKVDCGAGDALYRAESVSKSNRCRDDYVSRSVSSGSRSSTMCLYLDLRPGTCLRLWDPAKSASDPVRMPCGPGMTRVTQRFDGTSDRHRCPRGTDLVKTYTKAPVLTLCLETVK